MLIKSVVLTNTKKTLLFIFIIVCLIVLIYFGLFMFNNIVNNNIKSNVITSDYEDDLSNEELSNSISEYAEKSSNDSNSYIKWVDFRGTYSLLSKLSKLDISSHLNNDAVKFNWIELMSYLSCKYGGDFSKFNQNDLDSLVEKLKSGITISELTKDFKLYSYFHESLDALFHEYIGEYTIQVSNENGNKTYKTTYGLKVFSPIAKGYSFSHYNDFGTSRSYGYRRKHLGNDLLRKHWNTRNCCRIWLC